MFKKKVPFIYLLLFTLTGIAGTYFSDNFMVHGRSATPLSTQLTASAAYPTCDYSIMRLKGYKYIRPYLRAEPECESGKYATLKSGINDYINSLRSQGALTAASVYLTDLSKEEWMCVNPDEQYHPASLLKVASLMAYLRMAEQRPEIMNIQMRYDDALNAPGQTFTSKTIATGKPYSVKELLRYMIAYSDNRAAYLLHHNMDPAVFLKIFADMGLAMPADKGKEYVITARQYAEFFKVLYDGSYLTISASEYATSLLTECDFKIGIVKGLPASVRVAHKFGESGNDQIHELHESAIVYLDNNPYIITIMTKGPDLNKLAEVISCISRMSYEKMSSII